MPRLSRLACCAAAVLFGCRSTNPIAPAESQLPAFEAQGWGPETPGFNLEVILRGDNGGFGLVSFRQPNDDALVINLGTWVRNLTPNTEYQLQRAVDVTLDGECTSTAWLTLGKGTVPQTILTDGSGSGREELFRSVAAFPVGSTFDIHFRVIEAGSGAAALASGCYQFVISQ